MSTDRIFDKLDEISKVVTRLDTQMELLVGNGQPGRISKIEDAVADHKALINQAKGAKWVVGIIAAILALVAEKVIAAVLR